MINPYILLIVVLILNFDELHSHQVYPPVPGNIRPIQQQVGAIQPAIQPGIQPGIQPPVSSR